MAVRKYTVDEIERMRMALVKRSGVHAYASVEDYTGHCLRIEDQLRTYILNGTLPEELEED